MTQQCWMVLLKRKSGFDIVKAYGNSDASYIFFQESEAVRACQIVNQQLGTSGRYEVVEVAVSLLDPPLFELQTETFEVVTLESRVHPNTYAIPRNEEAD
ncbi:hypothetical protein [Nodosilinea nodulosa]|uniref:hypothetical protein n=1 Tax=Nodosilinea nodulosa TaxID=416001 RepID=UPI0012D73980|nr:hypothetical protein [Nodosilinea nodulosa]